MEMLTNDLRFTLYNICYKRVLVLWIFTAFVVLLALLFSGVQGLALFSLGVMWLVLNSAAIFLCMWIKIKVRSNIFGYLALVTACQFTCVRSQLNHNLERCMAQINRHLIRHKIIIGLDDRGRISCHKVNLCFIYFDTTECVVSIPNSSFNRSRSNTNRLYFTLQKKLQEIIEQEEAAGRIVSKSLTKENEKASRQFQERMDIDDQDIIIQGSTTTRVSRKQVSESSIIFSLNLGA